MKELKNQCLHHVSAGAKSSSYDAYCCEICVQAGLEDPPSSFNGIQISYSAVFGAIGGAIAGTAGKLAGAGYGLVLDNIDFEARARNMREQALSDYKNGELYDYD